MRINDLFKKTIVVNHPISQRFYDEELDKFVIAQKYDGASDDTVVREIPSTAIERFKYNPKKKLLTVRFVGGKTDYDFPNVPPEVVEQFRDASSKGHYYNAVVTKYSVNRRHK